MADLSGDPRGGATGTGVVGVPGGGGDGPAKALATVLSLNDLRADEALSVHVPSLARDLPRENSGVCDVLCDGTYSTGALVGLQRRGCLIFTLLSGGRGHIPVRH